MALKRLFTTLVWSGTVLVMIGAGLGVGYMWSQVDSPVHAIIAVITTGAVLAIAPIVLFEVTQATKGL